MHSEHGFGQNPDTLVFFLSYLLFVISTASVDNLL